jgi:hypothetical protein
MSSLDTVVLDDDSPQPLDLDLTLEPLALPPHSKVVFQPTAASDMVILYDEVEFHVHRYQLMRTCKHWAVAFEHKASLTDVVEVPAVVWQDLEPVPSSPPVSGKAPTPPKAPYGPDLTIKTRTQPRARDMLFTLGLIYTGVLGPKTMPPKLTLCFPGLGGYAPPEYTTDGQCVEAAAAEVNVSLLSPVLKLILAWDCSLDVKWSAFLEHVPQDQDLGFRMMVHWLLEQSMLVPKNTLQGLRQRVVAEIVKRTSNVEWSEVPRVLVFVELSLMVTKAFVDQDRVQVDKLVKKKDDTIRTLTSERDLLRAQVNTLSRSVAEFERRDADAKQKRSLLAKRRREQHRKRVNTETQAVGAVVVAPKLKPKPKRVRREPSRVVRATKPISVVPAAAVAAKVPESSSSSESSSSESSSSESSSSESSSSESSSSESE